jgi:peptide/nickel transport system ATP-binding protein
VNTPSQVVVRVQDVTRHFSVRKGLLKALDGVSFEVAEGQTLGIVGESGCGKSTLARLIVGIDQPTSGSIELGGMAVGDGRRDQKLRLTRLCQMIFQDPFSSLNPRMRVGEIIAEPLVIHGVGSASQRARTVLQLLNRVGLPRDSGRRFPHEFSGGQRQRIGIARALALKPRILVADEPVSALDVSVQAQILNLLADLRDELGLTLILVSHDLQVVDWMSDRVLVMYLGRIVEAGAPQALFDTPLHPYTRALVEASPSLDRIVDLDQVLTVAGEVPSALNPPSGCPYHPRCPVAQPGCSGDRPELRSSGGAAQERLVACGEAPI